MDKYDGMTVNERLFDAGLLNDFNRATADGDQAKIAAILAKVDLRQDARGMNWSMSSKEQSEVRKTLSVRPESERTEAPAVQKRGRGWNIAESRLDTLHETAREMRREPTEAQAWLHEALIAANLGKYRLKPQTVIGSAIVDFACQPLKIAVEIEEEGANAELDRRRDRTLESIGVKVLRYSAEQVLADVDAVVTGIVAEMKARWHEQRANAKPGRRMGGYKGDRGGDRR